MMVRLTVQNSSWLRRTRLLLALLSTVQAVGREYFVGNLTRGQVWLMPHNPAFDPIPGNDAAVLGKVVTVIRKI